MWPQLDEVMCFECHWEQKSSPCVQTHLRLLYHLPCASTNANAAVLQAEEEMWAWCRKETWEKYVFSAGWALDVLLWAEQELTSAQGGADDSVPGAHTRVRLSPPGLPTPPQWRAAASQDTIYPLLTHLALLPGFWHPLLAEVSCEVGDRQTVWN